MHRRLAIRVGSIVLLLVVGGILSWWLLPGQTPTPPQAVSNILPPSNTQLYSGIEARATLLARRDTGAPDTTSNTSGLKAATTTSIPATPIPTPIVLATVGFSIFNWTSTPSTGGTTIAAASRIVSYTASGPTPTPVDFISFRIKTQIEAQLPQAWLSYKQHFIEASGRVVDPTAGGITTSEGQSYALLRAVWMNDRETFDKVLEWTQANLQATHSGDLFTYKWGKDAENNWKVLDSSSASDADCDIALALVFASRRWNDPKYGKLALDIVTAIWDNEVVLVQDKPYLSAGDWATAKSKVPLNPSYLSPSTMRIFATLDPKHNWLGLVDSSYRVIRGCSETELAGVKPVKLPANWCGIDRQTGQLTLAQDYPRLNTDYGYDAFRTMWRVALDYKWFREPRALDYLTWSDTLRSKWKQDGKLAAVYDYAGNPSQTQEDLAVYSGDMANFMFTEPSLAQELVKIKLLPTFDNTVTDAKGLQAGWGDAQNYYIQNWVWFGLALYADALPNLAAVSPALSAGSPSTPSVPAPTPTRANPAASPTPLPSFSPAVSSPTPIIVVSPQVFVPATLSQNPPVTPSPAN